MRPTSCALALAATVVCGSCSGPGAPSAPSRDSAPVVTPAGPSVSHWTISGTVWVHESSGRGPADGGVMFGWVETGRSGSTTGPVAIDGSGRYAFQVSVATTNVTLQRSGVGHQPCAVVLEPTGDAQADLDIVTGLGLAGGHLPAELAARQPTLSGSIYEETAQGRRPVPNAWVWLDGLHGLGSLVADTRSDEAGRYLLCSVPDKPGLVLQVSAPGYVLFESTTGLVGLSTLDIQLRRENAGQPATRGAP